MSGNKVRQALIRLIKSVVPPSLTGTVKSVDESDHTCVVTPSNGGPDYEDVRLRAVVESSSDGVVSIPVTGSEVVISPLMHNANAYYISRFSKVKKYSIKMAGGAVMELDDAGNIVGNNGNNGGIPKASVIKSKLNTLEAQENALKTIVAAINTAGAASPGTPVTNGTLASFFSAFNVIAIIPTTDLELRDNKFKH